jgi:uncharacterized protein YyaL (SSP411 family)
LITEGHKRPFAYVSFICSPKSIKLNTEEEIMSDTPLQHKHTNQLIHETSPYLLQHAHNPVDWYAWGEEALRKAKELDKPILLSVGYSACHWCHVMERESFENEEIAQIMNENFVSIKVDREERPDIDAIYMLAVQALTGQGGWPMTMFLLPDGRPFYGGTYFPPRDRQYGGGGREAMPGFPRVLMTMAEAYANHREQIEEQAAQIGDYLRKRSSSPLAGRGGAAPIGALPLEMLGSASRELAAAFDPTHGGFGNAPKFPNTMSLEFLLRMHLHRVCGEIGSKATHPEKEIVETTLRKMANGGIYDQLGGGFHRYSVDAEWLTPHFEKMLYDNALLSRVYLHAFLLTGDAFYRRIVEETLDYVAREMVSPEGGFYSTQDADSEGVEGKFFTWTPEEVKAILSEKIAALFMLFYDVTEQGNFEGKNILRVEQDAQTVADSAHVTLERLQHALQQGRAALFSARERRVKPGRDEKILTSWNGLMLRSFAEAARYLERADYLQIAVKNANFLLEQLIREGRVLRTYKDGRAKLNGFLEDYTFLADGLLALYETDFEARWFVEARRLMDEAIRLFADAQNGGFFDTGSDSEELVSRPKDIMDNALPAGNSMAIEVLLRLAAFTGEALYRQRADDYLRSLADIMAQHPQSFGHALGALDFAMSPVKEFAIIGDGQASDTQALLRVINSRFLPNSVLACGAVGDVASASAVPLLEDRPLREGKATAYVCQHFACLAPVTTAQELAALL